MGAFYGYSKTGVVLGRQTKCKDTVTSPLNAIVGLSLLSPKFRCRTLVFFCVRKFLEICFQISQHSQPTV